MSLEFRYRGKVVTDVDIALIRQLILDNPNDSRWALSKKLCRAWNWIQPNGTLKDMVCRGLMLDQSPVNGKLSQIKPLRFCQVRRTGLEKLFNSLIEHYHYLGYCHPVGEQLKYIVYSQQKPIACLAWSSAPRHIGCRDRFIGWSAHSRKAHIHLLAYNSRFLILPWVRVGYLASHILARMAKIVCQDWQAIYRHPIYYLETFIEKNRFAGTCYKAANWIYLGDTTGRGKNDHTNKVNRSIKSVWGYPLSKHFRTLLSTGAP
jgi:hypothetical protein